MKRDKEFKVELVSKRKFFLVWLGGVSVFLILKMFTIALILFLLVAFLIAYKFDWLEPFIPKYHRTIKLSKEGFQILEEDKFIEWSKLKWYRMDGNVIFSNDFVLGVKGKLFPLKFSGVKDGKYLGHFYKMRNGIIHRGLESNLSFKNFYEYKIWKGVTYLMFFTMVGLPIIAIIRGDFLQNILRIIFIMVGLLTLILEIQGNQRAAKKIRTVVEKRRK